jgi:hypothetical protein
MDEKEKKIKLMEFIYLYETEIKKPLIIALGGTGRGLRGGKLMCGM